ncbi:hypothetical protein PIB30_088105 [Stylosanthes scabra]|uniref:Uncharacterized protein n=1 Tax=Stylosanthes scabra TaxID=79078 RepID=A0ABU6SVY2_9FABA|nr:hypothetical protein [Stylosanthes scabra]
MEAYNRAYQFHVNTVPSEEFWVGGEGQPCLPPPYKRPIGRPTKKRRRDMFEGQNTNQYSVRRKYGKTTCGFCKQSQPAVNNGLAPVEEGGEAPIEDQHIHQEAVTETELTQGYSQSQPEDEIHQEGKAKATMQQDHLQQPQTSNNLIQELLHHLVMMEGFRAKMPIVRSPTSCLRSAPTGHVKFKPTAASRPAAPLEPNTPFRPPQFRSNIKSSEGASAGIS